MENKTLTEVYSKARNRFAKVIYIFLLIVILLFVYTITISETTINAKNFEDFIITVIVVLLIFESIKRAFYYVAAGTIMPKK